MDDADVLLRSAGNIELGDVVGAHAVPGLIRRNYIARLKNVAFLLLQNQRLEAIHEDSGATIAIYSRFALRYDRLVIVDILGTEPQAALATDLMVHAMRQEYVPNAEHTMLFPNLHTAAQNIFIPLHRALAVLGRADSRIQRLERRAEAWIEVQPFMIPPNPGDELGRFVRMYCIEGQRGALVNFLLNEAEIDLPGDSDIEDH